MFEYDVAISFVGEQRKEAEAIADCLKKNEVNVFYDGYEKAVLSGKDLYERFCLMLVSAAYAAKVWPTHERRMPKRVRSHTTENTSFLFVSTTRRHPVLEFCFLLSWDFLP